MPEQFIINTNSKRLAYYFHENGCVETLFLFHGFGQNGDVFQPYIATLTPYYNILSIDLFFHGESNIEANVVDFISVKEWNMLFQQIVKKHAIQTFSVVAYSMGARFILSLMQYYSNRINRMVLIAPDGFGNNFWFQLATSTKLTRTIFKYALKHPSCIIEVIKLLSTFGIYNQATKRFMTRSLESKYLVDKIYISWVYVRKLVLPKKDFISIINREDIKLLCCCSTKDQMVSKKAIQGMCKETNSECILFDIPHQKMLEVIQGPKVYEFLLVTK